MNELKAPLQDSLSVKDLSTLVTNPVWIQWFNNILRYTIPALGIANQKLFVNSAGTESEWANGLYAGYITRGMTDTGAPTDVNYTGLPFKPSALILSMSLGNASISVGFADASNSYVQVIYGAATTYYHPNDSTCIWILEESGKEQKASLKTFNSDGFTLTWTKVGSPAAATCHGYYIAIR
jgi:hypothetical protein